MSECTATFEYPCGAVREVSAARNPGFHGCARFNHARPVRVTFWGRPTPDQLASAHRAVHPLRGVVEVPDDE